MSTISPKKPARRTFRLRSDLPRSTSFSPITAINGQEANTDGTGLSGINRLITIKDQAGLKMDAGLGGVDLVIAINDQAQLGMDDTGVGPVFGADDRFDSIVGGADLVSVYSDAATINHGGHTRLVVDLIGVNPVTATDDTSELAMDVDTAHPVIIIDDSSPTPSEVIMNDPDLAMMNPERMRMLLTKEDNDQTLSGIKGPSLKEQQQWRAQYGSVNLKREWGGREHKPAKHSELGVKTTGQECLSPSRASRTAQMVSSSEAPLGGVSYFPMSYQNEFGPRAGPMAPAGGQCLVLQQHQHNLKPGGNRGADKWKPIDTFCIHCVNIFGLANKEQFLKHVEEMDHTISCACNKTFLTPRGWNAHMREIKAREASSKDNDPKHFLTCGTCARRFRNFQVFMLHLFKEGHHGVYNKEIAGTLTSDRVGYPRLMEEEEMDREEDEREKRWRKHEIDKAHLDNISKSSTSHPIQIDSGSDGETAPFIISVTTWGSCDDEEGRKVIGKGDDHKMEGSGDEMEDDANEGNNEGSDNDDEERDKYGKGYSRRHWVPPSALLFLPGPQDGTFMGKLLEKKRKAEELQHGYLKADTKEIKYSTSAAADQSL